jgi:hypothetical protein
VLERRYLRDVESAHDLPRGTRQIRAPGQVRRGGASGTVVRDVRYSPFRTVVELDGAFGHRDAVDRWADLERDLAAAADGDLTLRAGWAQVMEPCELAATVAIILSGRGWQGRARACGPGCGLDRGRFESSDDSHRPRSTADPGQPAATSRPRTRGERATPSA